MLKLNSEYLEKLGKNTIKLWLFMAAVVVICFLGFASIKFLEIKSIYSPAVLWIFAFVALAVLIIKKLTSQSSQSGMFSFSSSFNFYLGILSLAAIFAMLVPALILLCVLLLIALNSLRVGNLLAFIGMLAIIGALAWSFYGIKKFFPREAFLIEKE